jgi:hypothetical protein
MATKKNISANHKSETSPRKTYKGCRIHRAMLIAQSAMQRETRFLLGQYLFTGVDVDLCQTAIAQCA